MAERFERLMPHVQVYGPADAHPRPTILIFHGCGGIAANMGLYAEVAVALGVRVYVVDSYGPRGWSRKFGANFVCKGFKLRGFERSGDVLAMLWGLSRRYEVDPKRIMLAGWSHGAWAIMDLMTQELARPGEARLADPAPQWLDGVRGLFLAYPYINFMARSVTRPWHHKPPVFTVLTLKDHLASYKQSLRLVKGLRAQGVSVDTMTLDSTHAFDEEGIDKTKIMRYDEAGLQSTLDAFGAFTKRVLL
ncbi:dienelactone hydrolase [Asticcacaulis biprosthecium C19]|uniref:Dienelactone hydrolase n=2 Tax=Asticcacaulis biprosthecium TaxID=76891 RepID=F4QHT7_9CAUL|nr:dienelactone hydrolase [Asticcacaulis biprosthecium C19]